MTGTEAHTGILIRRLVVSFVKATLHADRVFADMHGALRRFVDSIRVLSAHVLEQRARVADASVPAALAYPRQ